MSRVITAKADPEATRSYWTLSRGDADRAFRAARRHSRLVRILRIAVPVVVVMGLTIVTLITYFNPLRMLAKLPINIDSLVVSGTKVTMEQPRLSGFTSDARAYELTADTAAQDMTKPDIVELRNIRAKVEMQDKTSVEMTAVSGIYDAKGETSQTRPRNSAEIIHWLSGALERSAHRHSQGECRVRTSSRSKIVARHAQCQSTGYL